ncbi:MAG: HAD hydrolase-like protein [Bacilli bacterium]|nr:HAD hydrolase-like protein [Bacilli bacterium]
MLYKPSMYYKDIYSINYDKLKKDGITCLIFDLDNTLGLITELKCPEKTRDLVRKLQKDFLVLVCSNNSKTRIRPYTKDLGIGGVAWAMKPFTRGLSVIKKRYKLKKNEMAMIGDQLVTDVFSANSFKIKSILVDPLGKKDMKITFFNRLLEDRIIKKYMRKGIFERGKYYE